jgi:4-amino-4-deoxy-L-arabinose transferase-like glycosyltransferase
MTLTTRLAPVLDRRPRLVLALLCLVLWLPGFFNLPPTDRDESRFALATRQMIDSGDYVRIMNGAVPRSKKPIGIHWLQVPFVAAAHIAGVATRNPVWPYRVASLLGAMVAVLATAAIGETLLGGRRAGLLAGTMLAASVILTVEAHIAKTDAALLGATTVAMAVVARAWAGAAVTRGGAALFWLAMAAGILIKGPVTPMVVGLATIGACLSGWRVRWLAPLRPIWGVPLMAAAVLPWFVAIWIDTNGAFFTQAVGGDLGRKLGGGDESHGALPGLHLLLLPLLSFPSTVPVLLGLAAAVRRWRAAPIGFLLAWLVPAWLVFEAVPTKLPHYTLPLYPALCLLAADALQRVRLPGPTLAVARRCARCGLAAAALVLGGGALALPVWLHASPFLGVAPALLAGAAAWVAWRAGPVAGALAVVPLYAAILQFELPRLSALWVAPRAAAAVRAAWPEVPRDGNGVIAVGYAEPSLMFLLGPRLTFLPNGTLAAQALARTPHGAALIATPEVPAFLQAATAAGVREEGEIEGTDYARGRRVTLTLFVR